MDTRELQERTSAVAESKEVVATYERYLFDTIDAIQGQQEKVGIHTGVPENLLVVNVIKDYIEQDENHPGVRLVAKVGFKRINQLINRDSEGYDLAVEELTRKVTPYLDSLVTKHQVERVEAVYSILRFPGR